ncbi:MFS transporter [Photorhabdus laumondii]|uniref:MFS transporter n=1 Tax=Photorhabdus laumondii TaxID=2218628 RepID=UPI0025B03C80|nr:MFS transporter [Photorhabdus laumondii]
MSNMRMLSLVGIYLVIFIDNLGASLIIPMLTPIMHDPVAGLIGVGSESFRNMVYGVALGIFSIAMLFGAPLLGVLSDSLGRKKTLILCLSGLAFSYFFLALAMTFKSLWLFIVGRLIGGFFSGSLPVAQASIIDATEEKQRARFIGYIMFFVSLGYVVGPLIGGYLSDSAIIAWFNLKTPFIFVAALSVFNLLILLLVFQDKKTKLSQGKVTLPNPINSLLEAMRAKDIRIYFLILLLMLMGWNTFFQFIGLFLTAELNFSQQGVGSFVSWVGVGLAVAFLVLVGVLMKFLKPASMASVALILMVSCIGGSLLVTYIYFLYLLAFLGAVGFGLSYSGLMAQLSMSVDANRQGGVMGMAAAIAAFSAGFSGFVFGFVANISVSAPIIIALACVSAALIVSLKGLRVDQPI